MAAAAPAATIRTYLVEGVGGCNLHPAGPNLELVINLKPVEDRGRKRPFQKRLLTRAQEHKRFRFAAKKS